MMPTKKKKYNARFPAGRIKKIMQTDEDVGKVAQAVPVIISRSLELFVESLLTKTVEVTNSKCAKTLTPQHLKQCIQSETRFDFLSHLVSNIPDVAALEDEPTTPITPGVAVSFPPVQKKEGGTRGRPRGSGGGARLSTSNNRSSTSTYPPKTFTSSQPTTPITPITPTYPTFYKEIPIGSDNSDPCLSREPLIRPPVIQHTANHRPALDDSGDEEEEDDVLNQPAENGYSSFPRSTISKPLLIDDDYDT